MDDAGRYTAEHTVMDANLEIGKLKHLLESAEDNIEKLKIEIVRLKAEQKLQFIMHEDPTSMVLNFDEDKEVELRSVASEKYNKFGVITNDWLIMVFPGHLYYSFNEWITKDVEIVVKRTFNFYYEPHENNFLIKSLKWNFNYEILDKNHGLLSL